MANPPPGHPHYLPDEVRQALTNPPKEKIMTATAAQQKYQELRNKIVEARKTMEETAKSLFNEMSAELFNENPTLMSFGWVQYTPYFNDGDACTFRCNSDYPTVSITVDGILWSYDSNSGELHVDGEEVESSDNLIRMIKNMGVDSFSKEGKQYAFDRATNTVTENGVKVLSYNDIHQMFKPLEEIVSSFMRNFAHEDMEIMFGDHVTVTVSRDGKMKIEEYQHD